MKATRYAKVVKNFGYFLAFGLAHSAWALHRQNIKAQVENKRLHVLIMTGGLGDIVAADPAIRRITREDEQVVVLARPSYLAALDFHPRINTKIRVDSYVQALLLRRIFGLARWTNLHEDGHRCISQQPRQADHSDSTAMRRESPPRGMISPLIPHGAASNPVH